MTDISQHGNPMTIVVGTGRCGSTMISNILRKHPDVLSLSEFFVLLEGPRFREGITSASQFWKLLSTPNPFLTNMLRHQLNIQEFLYPVSATSRYNAETGVPPILLTTLPHLTNDHEALYDEIEQFVATFPPDRIEQHYQRLFGWLLQRFERKTCVERSGASLPMISSLVKLFPSAKFVHIARDGRECAMSMSRHAAFRLIGLVELQDQAQGVRSTFLSDRGSEETSLRAKQLGNLDLNVIINAKIPLTVFGSIWSKLIVLGTHYLSTLPEEQVLTLTYGQFVTHPETSMKQLMTFIDPSLPQEAWIQSTSAFMRQKPPSWRELPANELALLEDACRPGFDVLEVATHEGLHSKKLAELLDQLDGELLLS